MTPEEFEARQARPVLFLPDGLAMTAVHCGARMRETGSTSSWIGKPGMGYSLSSLRLTCSCGATVTIEVKERS